MEKSNTLTILKSAILMERKGRCLYLTAMDQAEEDAVKTFFRELADDELEHVAILEKQFKAYMKDGKFVAGDFENDGSAAGAPDILNESIAARINAAGFEATAITAAIGFEERAVKAYAEQAEKTDDPEEKKLYKWLSVWEKTHLKKLMALEESLMQNVWQDNSFWPM